jgi:peptidoglycan/LPS O-acetylase OafA/YrhL
VQRIAGFDFIRAIAIIAVVLTHVGFYGVLREAGILDQRAINLLNGGTGVQIFFVLSGFLITILLVNELNETGNISLPKFFARRALRIFPLYFLVLILIILFHLFIWPLGGMKPILFAATYTTNFIPQAWYSTTLGHTWTLAVEEHFYLIWPFLICVAIKFRWDRAAIVLAGFIACSAIAHNMLSSIPFLRTHFFIERWSIIAGSNIALGCLMAILITLGYKCFHSRWALFTAAALFCHSLFFGDMPGHLDDLIRGAGISIFVSWIYLNQESAIVRALEFPPMRYVGMISYGIYMWQGFFLSTGTLRVPGQLWPPPSWLGLLCLAVVAPLSFHFFERPALRFKRRFSSFPKAEHPRPSSIPGKWRHRTALSAVTASIASKTGTHSLVTGTTGDARTIEQ